MMGMMPHKVPGGKWVYPDLEEVFKVVGLYTIIKYVEVRRNTILRFVEQRPIYELFREAGQQRGSGNRKFRWE